MTLLELLIAVSIVAIFAAIAYPSFNNYVYQGHRNHASWRIWSKFNLVLSSYTTTVTPGPPSCQGQPAPYAILLMTDTPLR